MFLHGQIEGQVHDRMILLVGVSPRERARSVLEEDWELKDLRVL
jgi:hypothetical protein